LDKLAFLTKPEIKLERKLEHCSFQKIRSELPSFRSSSSN